MKRVYDTIKTKAAGRQIVIYGADPWGGGVSL